MAAPRVALATCADLPDLDPDERLLLPALEALGVAAEPAVWSDPTIDWAGFALVVVRSTWDYASRRTAFLAWAERVPRLANPVPVLAWNTDKRYLAALAGEGVPVVPTTWVAPGWAFSAPPGEYVVKPTVSAGAKDTARYGPGDAEPAGEHVARLGREGRTAMVQPYLGAVDRAGETALVYVGGQFSHAIRKGPLLQRGKTVTRGLFAPETITRREPVAAERELAVRVLAAAGRLLPGAADLLYARVDVVPGADGKPVLLELELTEPSLFLAYDPAAAGRLATAVAAWLAEGR